MSSGLNKIFWGLIIVFFDINMEAIDILPDFLGYLFIAYGFCAMKSMNNIEPCANKGYIIAYAVTALELISIVINYCFGSSGEVQIDMFGGVEVVNQAPNFFLMIISVIPIISVFMLNYYILKVIYIKGMEINSTVLTSESNKYFKLLSLIVILNLVITPFLINYHRVDVLDIFWSFFVVFVFIVNILYIICVKKAEKIFNQESIQLEFEI